MEVKFKNVVSKNFNKINTTFFENEIISIISNCENYKFAFIDLIRDKEKKISGEIIYDLKNESNNSLENEIKKTKNFIFYLEENYENMLFNINIKEDIKFYLNNYDCDKLNELLNAFNLDDKILDKNYSEISSSEFRKILIIIALLSKSKIIILINPTLKLDFKSIQTLISQLKKIKRANKTVIISSHNTNFLLEVSDRIIVLEDKQIVYDGKKYDVLSNEKLLAKINLNSPNILNFINKAKKIKNIKLGYRDNINDLIKDIYRNA